MKRRLGVWGLAGRRVGKWLGGNGGSAALCLSVLIALALDPPAAVAQTAAQIPLEITVDQNAIIRQYAPPLKRPPTIGVRVSAPVAGIPAEKLGETQFTLTSVAVEGAVSLDPRLLAPAWQGLVGKQISLLDLRTALEAVENIYRRHDIAVVATAPPQDFTGGNVRIVVSEVYIKDLLVKGDLQRLRGRLDPLFARIAAMRPLRISETYRALLIAEDQAGVNIYGVYTKIEDEPGAARLELTISFNPGNLVLGLDNYGGRDVGPLQASARAHVNDVFGLFEATDIVAVANPANPARLALLGVSQSVPFGLSGLSLSWGISNSWANPGGLSLPLRLHSEVLTASVGLNYALLRTMERNVIVSAGLFGNNASVDALEQPIDRSRTRWVGVSAKYDDSLGGVTFILNPAFLHGIDAFEANVPFSDFQLATLNAVATTNLTETLSARLMFNGQYAFTTLPTAMLGVYGGEPFGRAYDPGALAGNHTLTASLELAQRIDTGVAWLPGFSLLAYGDYGAAWNPPGSGYAFASLASIGFGLRTGIGERLIASALVAQPLTYDPDLAALGVEQTTRYRFTVALRF